MLRCMSATDRPTDTLVRDVADRLGRDPRTVVRVLAGLPVRGCAEEAIRRELLARGAQPASISPPAQSAA